MILSVTGHRPNKLGGYSPEAAGILFDTAVSVLNKYNDLSIVITGMALGWDMAIARACISLEIPFHAAIPFKGQETMWPVASQTMYHTILSKATITTYVCDPGYAAYKMQKRNEFMVNTSDRVAALWDGSPGGTMNCVNYARKIGKPVDSCWDTYIQVKHQYA